jgi:hypothetical protein
MVIKIRILDHVARCSNYDDGEIIYNLLYDAFIKGNKVELSFDGVLSVPSAFINAGLVQLLSNFPFSYIRENLHIVNSTKQINELVRQRFEFASKSNGEI